MSGAVCVHPLVCTHPLPPPLRLPVPPLDPSATASLTLYWRGGGLGSPPRPVVTASASVTDTDQGTHPLAH